MAQTEQVGGPGGTPEVADKPALSDASTIRVTNQGIEVDGVFHNLTGHQLIKTTPDILVPMHETLMANLKARNLSLAICADYQGTAEFLTRHFVMAAPGKKYLESHYVFTTDIVRRASTHAVVQLYNGPHMVAAACIGQTVICMDGNEKLVARVNYIAVHRDHRASGVAQLLITAIGYAIAVRGVTGCLYVSVDKKYAPKSVDTYWTVGVIVRPETFKDVYSSEKLQIPRGEKGRRIRMAKNATWTVATSADAEGLLALGRTNSQAVLYEPIGAWNVDGFTHATADNFTLVKRYIDLDQNGEPTGKKQANQVKIVGVCRFTIFPQIYTLNNGRVLTTRSAMLDFMHLPTPSAILEIFGYAKSIGIDTISYREQPDLNAYLDAFKLCEQFVTTFNIDLGQREHLVTEIGCI